MQDSNIKKSNSDIKSEGLSTSAAAKNLRPSRLKEFIGQDKLCENLRVFAQSAKKRGEPLDHVLLSGPAGLGKTTLARLLGNELDVQVRETSGPVLTRPGDLAALISSLSPMDILFIDEIHRLNATVEEILYPAMEDGYLDIMVGKGVGAKSVKIKLPPFTLVGATTRMGMLSTPLRERFGINFRLFFYNEEDMKIIVERYAKLLKLEISPGAISILGSSSRGTPRIAVRLIKRVRDFMTEKGLKTLEVEECKDILNAMSVDSMGLDSLDRRYLRVLREQFGGGPAGLESLAAALSETTETIEDVLEPYLMQLGLIQRTAKGRILADSVSIENLEKDE